MGPNYSHLKWVPWKRYALVLTNHSAGKKMICAGRFRFSKSADREAGRLNRYRGYEAVVVDTRAGIKPAPTGRGGDG